MSGVDIVMRGEGEDAVAKIAAAPASADHLHTIEGLEFRNGGQIVRTSGTTWLPEHALQQLPVPAYDLVPDSENTQIYIVSAENLLREITPQSGTGLKFYDLRGFKCFSQSFGKKIVGNPVFRTHLPSPRNSRFRT